jgi:DHA2 family methylenomycin A resistance protein-like MFS transporter
MTAQETRTVAAPARPPAAWPRAATLIGTSLGFGVIQLDVTVVNVAVKAIGGTFGGGIAELQWVVSSYVLMFAALILPAGALGDRFGAKRVLCAGFVIFVAASMACGLAPDFAVLIAARAVQGAGAALLGSCSLALLNYTFTSPADRARAIGQWAAGASAALSGGPVIGGILIATLGWRSIFFINTPIGLAGLWLVWRYAKETPRAARRGMDLAGAVSAVIALAAFAAAIIEAGSDGFTSPWVLGGLVVSALAVAVFIRSEARTAQPVLPLSLFRHRPFVAPVSVGFLVNVCVYGLIFLFSLRAGAILAGLVAMAIGCAALLRAGPGTGYPALVGQQILLGGGLGLLVPPMTGLLLSGVDRSRSGAAAGALTAFRQAGSLLGVAIFGALAGGGHFFPGLHLALWTSIAILAASGALVGLVRGR